MNYYINLHTCNERLLDGFRIVVAMSEPTLMSLIYLTENSVVFEMMTSTHTELVWPCGQIPKILQVFQQRSMWFNMISTNRKFDFIWVYMYHLIYEPIITLLFGNGYTMHWSTIKVWVHGFVFQLAWFKFRTYIAFSSKGLNFWSLLAYVKMLFALPQFFKNDICFTL